MVALNTLCLDSDGKNTCFIRKRNERDTSDELTEILQGTAIDFNRTVEPTPLPKHPFVLVTSLPGSGSDLLEKVFAGSSKSLHIAVSKADIPVDRGNSKELDLCIWMTPKQEFRWLTIGWFESLRTNPILHFNQAANKGIGDDVRRHMRQNLNVPIVLNDDVGFWLTKLPWISQAVGKKDFQSIFVVRDPRSWIHMLISEFRIERTFTDTLENMEQICHRKGTSIPYYFPYFQNFGGRHVPDDIEKLAMLWTISTGTVLVNVATHGNGQWPLHVVRFEDILGNPEGTITDMFLKLGFHLGIKSLNKIIRVVRSGHYEVPYDGVIAPEKATAWKDGLSEYDVKKIEKICCKMMRILGYKCG